MFYMTSMTSYFPYTNTNTNTNTCTYFEKVAYCSTPATLKTALALAILIVYKIQKCNQPWA